MAFLASRASASGRTSIRGDTLVCRLARREDIHTKIRWVPELHCDEDAEGQGAAPSGTTDRSGATTLAGIEDSFLGVLLGPEEPPAMGWASTASVWPHFGVGAAFVFFFTAAARRIATSSTKFIAA